jgi:acyl homoserine lactone synthase
MIQLITGEFHEAFRDELAEMHRLRCRVFKDRLGWSVEIRDGQEIDRFDALKPDYLLLRIESALLGSVRFLPTTGPTMLRDTFPELLGGQAAPASDAIWESSRFALDLAASGAARPGGLASATYQLFAGMIEFGLGRGLTHIVTVTDARMERILRRAGWPLNPIGRAAQLGDTMALAGYLDVSHASLAAVRARGGFAHPVLWRPVLDRPA